MGVRHNMKQPACFQQTANNPSIVASEYDDCIRFPHSHCQLGLGCLNQQASGQTALLLLCQSCRSGVQHRVITLKVADHKETMATPNCQIDSHKQIFLS